MNKSYVRAKCPVSVSTLHDCEVDAVVHAAVLGNRGKNRLVVRGSVDREETVGTGGKALGDVSSNDTGTVRGSVEALEESELGRVRGLGLVEGGEGFDDDMRVTDDNASVVDLSRSSVVVGLSVHEETELYDEVGIGRLNKQRAELILVRTCKFLTFIWMVKG